MILRTEYVVIVSYFTGSHKVANTDNTKYQVSQSNLLIIYHVLLSVSYGRSDDLRLTYDKLKIRIFLYELID